MAKKIPKSELNEKQELFCQFFSSSSEFFGNGVHSYQQAYGEHISYDVAKVCAHKLLTNANILKRIDDLIEITMNDQMVDKELSKVIKQDAEFSSKVAAIREYNRLRKRIDDKQQNTTNIYIEEQHKKKLDSLINSDD